MVLVPGLLIIATILAFSVIADGIRVALDRSITQASVDEPPAELLAVPVTAGSASPG
jgi:hypothetical protein